MNGDSSIVMSAINHQFGEILVTSDSEERTNAMLIDAIESVMTDENADTTNFRLAIDYLKSTESEGTPDIHEFQKFVEDRQGKIIKGKKISDLEKEINRLKSEI